MFWFKVKSFFQKVWEFIKKVPGKIWIGVIIVAAVVYYFVRRAMVNKKLVEIQGERLREERRLSEAIQEIGESETEKLEELEAEYASKMKELDLKQDELEEIARKGPKAISDEWVRYWKSQAEDEND